MRRSVRRTPVLGSTLRFRVSTAMTCSQLWFYVMIRKLFRRMDKGDILDIWSNGSLRHVPSHNHICMRFRKTSLSPGLRQLNLTKDWLFELTEHWTNEGEVDGLKMFVDKGRCVTVGQFFFSHSKWARYIYMACFSRRKSDPAKEKFEKFDLKFKPGIRRGPRHIGVA